jgi:capsular exopolysaccharide synthesis family protein
VGLNPAYAEKLVSTAGDAGALVEQYRKLAATLHYAQAHRGIRVVMIASAVASEGKTLTASNLALTLSQSYRRRVLLIDADLRRPSVHTVFRVPNVYGLNDELKSATPGKLSQFAMTSHLSIVTAGRPDPDPIGGLTSGRMRDIVADAASQHDWVIIDTPPVGLLPDANLLSSMVDGAILVVAAGRTPFGLVERAVNALGRERIFGVVLNRVDARSIAGGYDYYGYYGANHKRGQRGGWFFRR